MQRAKASRAKSKAVEEHAQKKNGSGYRSLQEEMKAERKNTGSGRSPNEQLERRLESGHRTMCLRAAASILETGADIKDEHLQQLLEQAALRPGAMQFAMVLWLVSVSRSVTIGVEPFLRGLGSLVQQGAPSQQIRLWLNLAMPKASPALGPLPEGFSQEERQEAARELEDACSVLTEDEDESGRGAPKDVLCFTGCLMRPELNGRYQMSDMTSHHKPVYQKIVEKQRATTERESGKAGKSGKGRGASAREDLMIDDGEGEGAQQDVIVVHYRKKREGTDGWFFSRKTCSGEELAWTAREAKTPPGGGWFVIRKGAKLPDPLRIVDGALSSGPAGGSEAMRVMGQIDFQRLRGRLVAPDGSDYAAEYFGHFCALMHLEHLEELRQLRRRALRAPPELDGLECAGVFGRKDGRKADALGWEDPGSEMGVLLLPPHLNIERLRVKRGDSVNLSEAGAGRGRHGGGAGPKLEGTVADMKPARGREAAQMVVKVRGAWPDNAMTCAWRVDQGANSTLYERQLQALLEIVVKPRGKICELLVTAGVGGVDAWVARCRGKGGARPAVSKNRAKDKAISRRLAKFDAPGGTSQKLHEALEEAAALKHLNASQRDAVKAAMRQTCTIVQGPPGTGKTHVSVQILKMWARTLGISPLLATSDSNVAVDNIAMGLQAQGVKVLRVGRPEKVNRIIDEITLETAVERELARAAADLEAAQSEAGVPSASLEESSTSTLGGTTGTKEAPRQKRGDGQGKDDCKGKAKGKGITPKMRYDLQMKVLRSAEVLCCTSIAAGGDFFSKFSFAGILVDEAAQATELSAVVPLILRGTQRLVLVGDHCQLPPTVQSNEAQERGLSVSLYSRLMEGGGLPAFMLDTQYRSHPLLAAFSARAFYQGQLKTGISAADRPPPRGPRWPRKDVPLAFVEVEASEQQDGDSKMNPGEAEVVADLLRDVLAKGELGVKDVGVVTPYVAQVRCLRRIARSVVPQGTDPMLLEIASVDNFQGREKDLIVFSAVRSNQAGAVGFLADWRRLNVMITRARRGLVVCGNSRTLRTNEHWSAWLEFYKCAAAGEPLPRTPSPERRRRAKEAEAEKERLRQEEAEAEAEAAAAEKAERERKRAAASRPQRSPQTRRSPQRPRRETRPKDSRPMSRRFTVSPDSAPGDDFDLGAETFAGDAELLWEQSAAPAAPAPEEVQEEEKKPPTSAKNAALDALAKAWSNSSLARTCVPKADESSSEIELDLDSDG